MDKEAKQMFELIISKLDNLDRRISEIQVIQRGLEENIKVTRAVQDKMMYAISEMQGKALKLTKEVEEQGEAISKIRTIQ